MLELVLTKDCKERLANDCVEKLIVLKKSDNDSKQSLLHFIDFLIMFFARICFLFRKKFHNLHSHVSLFIFPYLRLEKGAIKKWVRIINIIIVNKH